MKLNERALASLAADSTPPDKCGFLLKKGEVNKGFQKRYFVLRGNMLFYFEKKQDKEAVGVIILENCHVELCASDISMHAFQIVFDGSGTRTYVLAADNNDEMECWMKFITHAGYDHMNALVEELEKRLETLKQAESEMAPTGAECSKNLSPTSASSDPKSSDETKAAPRKPLSRAKNRTLPAIRTHKRNQVLSDDPRNNRWSFSPTLTGSHQGLPEVDTSSLQDLINLSERTDFLYNNSFHSSRHFSINDFTPPSFSELKKYEEIEDQTMFDIKRDPREDDTLSSESFAFSQSFTSRILDIKRANSERPRRSKHISPPKTSVDDLFACRRKSLSDDSRTKDECQSSQFQHLHSLWGAAIWVKVHEYEHGKTVDNTSL